MGRVTQAEFNLDWAKRVAMAVIRDKSVDDPDYYEPTVSCEALIILYKELMKEGRVDA